MLLNKADFKPGRLIRLAAAFLLVMSLSAGTVCSANAFASEAVSSPAESKDMDINAFAEALGSIEGISDVSVTQGGSVLAYIEQPLDWQSDTGMTFKQKFIVTYKGSEQPTSYEIGGYSILYSFSMMSLYPADYTHNAVDIEYRFFGESVPEGLDSDSADLWEFLTVENAAEDFHALITKLSTLLTGKRMVTGVSKGGFTTNVQAYKHPEDADLFLSFCAPLCDSLTDSRMYEFLNYSVGDDVLPEGEGEHLRSLITDFQLECIRYEDDLKVRYKEMALEEAKDGEKDYRSWLLEDDGAKLYETAVADMQGAVWMAQGGGGGAAYESAEGMSSTFGTVVSMPAETPEEIQLKEDAVFELLSSISFPTSYTCSLDQIMLPYCMQSAMQMGNYAVDLTPLRERMAEERERDPAFPDLSISTEEEKNLMLLTYLTEEQLEMAEGFELVHDELVEWEQTTTANVVMVFGGVDPWLAVAIPECDNPNVKRVLVKSSEYYDMIGHSCSVPFFDSETQDIIYGELDKLIS